MTDEKYKEASLILATDAQRLANALEAILPKILPVAHWDKVQEAFRYAPGALENPVIFCWLKLTGAVATVVPMCSLMAIRSCFAAAILSRSIHESLLSIYFMMPQPGASEWPNDKQKTALQNFCKEIWDDYLRPFETEKNTSQIRLDDLCASFGKHVGGQPEANPHDMTQTARHLMMFFSNYTHMGYPALMELFRDPQPRLSGKEDIHGYFTLHQAAKVLAEVCHVTSALLIRHDRGMEEFTADHKKELRELFQQQKKVVDAISQRLEAGFSRGDCSKQILRAFKKGKPIDDLLDAPNPAKTQLKGEV